jgi:uncharacterized membrane protein required for colicin V production
LCAPGASYIISCMFTIVVIVVLLLCVLWGYLRGALRNVLGLAAFTIAYFASAPFGNSLGAWMAGHWQLSAGSGYILGRCGAGLAIYVSLQISARLANRRFGQDETGVTRAWNRNLGALMGLAYGLALVLVVVFLADSLHKAGVRSGFVQGVSGSWLDRQVSAYNPADRFMLTDTLKLLRDARDDPRALERLRQQPQVQALLDRPDVRAVLEDKGLAEAIQEGNYSRVLSNPRLGALLKDREFMRQVFSPQLRQAVQQAQKGQGATGPAGQPLGR